MISPIHFDEFAYRRERVRKAVQKCGLKGLVVCSRGGGTLDRFADVAYLANCYTPFPYIPDVAGNWSGRAHAFLLLPVEGEAMLVIDVAPGPDVALPQHYVVKADFVTAAVIQGLEALGLSAGPVGLVGGDALPASAYRELTAALPQVEWQDAQPLLNQMRSIKSPAEIELLRRAAELGSRIVEAMMEAAAPGRTHGEILGKGLEVLMARRGMLYNAFIRSGRGGPDPTFVSCSLPTWGAAEALDEGHFFAAGISGIVDGYYFDLARSRPVGRVPKAQIEVFESAVAVVGAGVAALKPGATADAVYLAGEETEAKLGFTVSSSFQGLGHGIGLGWDDPWLAPGVADTVKSGMVMCVEKWLMRDGFGADFEETVVVTDREPETITDARVRYW